MSNVFLDNFYRVKRSEVKIGFFYKKISNIDLLCIINEIIIKKKLKKIGFTTQKLPNK